MTNDKSGLTLRQAQEIDAKRFVMPVPDLGQNVIWYESGVADSERAWPAVVCYVGADTLALLIMSKDSYTMMPKDGVRHHKDPALARETARENGAWAFLPSHYEQQELNLALKALLSERAARRDEAPPAKQTK